MSFESSENRCLFIHAQAHLIVANQHGRGTPASALTERSIPDQQGKVFIVTGGTSGIGRELSEILYSHHARVYIAARSAEKANATIETLKSKYRSSKGDLIFLKLDLNDLTTIKASAKEFLRKEKSLDVLWNNAGVMNSSTCVAPFLFTKLLTPILADTAKSSPPASTRVVWISSSATGRSAPNSGVDMKNLDYKNDKGAWHKYGVSKAGNILQAKAFADRYRSDEVVSVALDPGNLRTPLYRNVPRWQAPIKNIFLKDPIFGAYTELFGGLSPAITLQMTGAWIEPWAQIKTPRADIERAGRSKEDGGSGVGEEFWAWCEEEVRPYL